MTGRRRGIFTLSWDDPDEAFEVAEVLKAAGWDFKKGKVKDSGFYEDAMDLYRQIEEEQDDA